MNQRGCDREVIRVLQACLARPIDVFGDSNDTRDAGGAELPVEITDALDRMDRSTVRRLVVEALWRLR